MGNKIRGIRYSVAPNTLLGRSGAKGSAPLGDVQVIPANTYATQGFARAWGLQYISDGYLLANTSGASALPIGTPFTANGGYLDYVFTGAVQGDIIYRDSNANGWKRLTHGTSGQVLTTNGASANPSWTGAALTAIADGDVLANTSGGPAIPIATGLSALIDYVFGNTRGAILERGSGGWHLITPGTATYVFTSNGAGADPSWQAAGGGATGYPKGTPPTVVQTAKSNASASVTFGAAPTNGNLMIAMWVSPTASSAGTGWTVVGTDTSGTDFSVIAWKKAGAGESTTQTPIAGGNPTNCGLVVWELNGQNASQPIVTATSGHTTGSNVQSGWTGANTWTVANVPMDANCIGLAMTGVASGAMTIVQAKNVGTQDQATLSGGSRQFVAGHTDLSQTPTCGIILNWSGGNADCKSMACVVTA